MYGAVFKAGWAVVASAHIDLHLQMWYFQVMVPHATSKKRLLS